MHHSIASPELRNELYGDPLDPRAFRRWLRLLMGGQIAGEVSPDFGGSRLADFAGLLTRRYCRFFLHPGCQDRVDRVSSHSALVALDAETRFVNDFIHQERLESDLIAVLARSGYALDPEQRELVRVAPHQNVSGWTRNPEEYYDKELIELVADRDRFVIERFGYAWPDQLPSQPTRRTSAPRADLRRWEAPSVETRSLLSADRRPAGARGEDPRTILFRFSDRIGTFANVNALVYFCAWKDPGIRVLLADNDVLEAKVDPPSGSVTEIVGTPFSPRNRERLRPVLGELPRAGEHMRAATYQRTDLHRRRRQLHRAFHREFRFREEIVRAAEPLGDTIRKQSTLGVHLRFTRHYGTRPDHDAYLRSFFAEIDRRLTSGECQQLFVATHMADALAAMRRRYGARVLQYEQYRNPDRDGDWMGNKPMDQERREVAIDMLLLASCAHVVGGPSNVLYAALWRRPELPFSIVPILEGVNAG